MLRTFYFSVLILALAAMIPVAAMAAEQTMCPISGKAIDKSHYVDYKGMRVYFCCPNCPADFNKDPDKYIEKMKAEGITLAKAPMMKEQTMCPVSGKPIDKANYVDYKGKRVYFCCADCPVSFKKDPEKYMKKLKAEGVKLEDVPKKM